MDWETILSKSRQVKLPDGRHLGYSDYGAPDGFPIFYFHGCPGSRLEASLAADAAARQDVRLIAIDRPGYGLSDPWPERQLLDWSSDVAALAGILGLERFSILGASGGGPFALACALSISGPLHRVGLAAGLAPFREEQLKFTSRIGLLFARAALPIIQSVLESQARSHPDRAIALAARLLSEPDRKLLGTPEVNSAFQRSLQEAFRQGRAGMHRDMNLYGEYWGFSLKEINFPIDLWHGEEDRLLSPDMARRQADMLPHATLHLVPGEGHFSLPVSCADELLKRLRP